MTVKNRYDNGRIKSGRIIYIQYTNPACYPPLQHSSRILADRGWDVLFLGTGCFGASDAFNLQAHPRIMARRLSFYGAPWLQRFNYILFSVWALGHVILRHPDWVYLSNTSACAAGLILSYITGAKIIYHEHDSPCARPDVAPRGFRGWTRKALAKRADICVLPNEKRAAHFSRQTGRTDNVFSIWNCPGREETGHPKGGVNKKGIRLYYHGSLVPARKLETVLQAMKALPDEVRLDMVGYETEGYTGYTAQLKDMARDLSLAGRVRFLPAAVTRKELFERSAEGDLGIMFVPKKSEDINETGMAGASNKPFEYLAAGMPFIMTDLPDWRALYAGPGYALCCDPDDPEDVAAKIRCLMEDPGRMRQMGEKGRRRIAEEWNYEKQFGPVLERLSRSI